MSPLHGLVLTGGHSRRMGTDKAGLRYHGVTQIAHTYGLLRQNLAHVCVSVRPDQVGDTLRSGYPLIVDHHRDIGSAAGLLAAHAAAPDAAWLVVAIDMPFLEATLLKSLIAARNTVHAATLLAQPNAVEPLCGIWEAAALRQLSIRATHMTFGLRDALAEMSVARVYSEHAGHACFNANRPAERAFVLDALQRGLRV